jgi:hypothetical protein
MFEALPIYSKLEEDETTVIQGEETLEKTEKNKISFTSPLFRVKHNGN